MMNVKQQLASEIRRMLEVWRFEARLDECRALTDIEQKLAKVGDLEHAAHDAEARIAAMATAEAVHNDALAHAKKIRSDAKAQADDTIARALEERDRLLAVAKADADGVRAAADSYREVEHGKARHAEHQARAVVGGHEAELVKVAEARAERERLQQEADAKLAETNAKLEAAKAKLVSVQQSIETLKVEMKAR
jgi:cell division septum initiation protein DivIVA